MNNKIIFAILLSMVLAPLGIEAKKKVKKEQEVPQLLNYPSAKVSEYRLHGGNVVVQGQFVIPEEANGEKIPQEVLDQLNGRFTVIMRDYIVRKEKTSVIEFKNDGTFSMNVYVPYPMFVLLYPMGTVYACPGDTVSVTIDTTKQTKEEGVTFDGTGLSGEVTRLYEKIRKSYCDFPARDNIHEKGPDSLMAWKDVQVACLDDVVRNCKSFLEPNNIKGEHIFITRSEWGYLQEKFQFSGVPFVLIYDKQGKRRDIINVTVEQLLNE